MIIQMGDFEAVTAVGIRDQWVSILDRYGVEHTLRIIPDLPLLVSGMFGSFHKARTTNRIDCLTLKRVTEIEVKDQENLLDLETKVLRVITSKDITFEWRLYCYG